MALIEVLVLVLKFAGTGVSLFLFLVSSGNWWKKRFGNDGILRFFLGLLAIVGLWLSLEGFVKIPRLEVLVRQGLERASGRTATTPRQPNVTAPSLQALEDATPKVAQPSNEGADESVAWRLASKADDLPHYQAYLRNYPNGAHSGVARQEITSLQTQANAPPPASSSDSNTEASPLVGGSAYVNNKYSFRMTKPPGWTTKEETSDDPTVWGVDLVPQRFTEDHAVCSMVVGDESVLTQSQDELNALVARGEADFLLKKPLLNYDAGATIDQRKIVRLGGVVGQEGEVGVTAKDIRYRARRLVVLAPLRSYSLTCIAPTTLYDNYRLAFSAIVSSFRILPHKDCGPACLGSDRATPPTQSPKNPPPGP